MKILIRNIVIGALLLSTTMTFCDVEGRSNQSPDDRYVLDNIFSAGKDFSIYNEEVSHKIQYIVLFAIAKDTADFIAEIRGDVRPDTPLKKKIYKETDSYKEHAKEFDSLVTLIFSKRYELEISPNDPELASRQANPNDSGNEINFTPFQIRASSVMNPYGYAEQNFGSIKMGEFDLSKKCLNVILTGLPIVDIYFLGVNYEKGSSPKKIKFPKIKCKEENPNCTYTKNMTSEWERMLNEEEVAKQFHNICVDVPEGEASELENMKSDNLRLNFSLMKNIVKTANSFLLIADKPDLKIRSVSGKSYELKLY